MKRFKIKPKVALIIILGLVTLAGIIVYMRATAPNKVNGDAEDKSFFSFFGERKIKPLDDNTVPGASTGGSGSANDGVTGGDTNGGDIGGGSTSSTSGLTGGSGSLSLRPIGTNVQSGGTTSLGSTGAGTGGTGSGGFTGGTGSTTGGGTNNNPGQNIPQVDCSPVQLPYTDAEIAELKELTQRFYRIAANLHTDVDIENERLTRKSYYDLYNQTLDYTKQCYAELKDPKYADKAKNANAEWHPYLTDTVLKRIAVYDPRVKFVINSEEASLNQQISTTNILISRINTQIAFIDSLGSNANAAQKNLRDTLSSDLQTQNSYLAKFKKDLADLKTTTGGISKGVVGSFFTEDVYKLTNLRVPRLNKNARIDRIWRYAGEYGKDSGNKIWGQLFDPDNPNIYYPLNPLKTLIKDYWDDKINDAPRYDPGNPPEHENLPQSYMHIFRMVEDGLRIW